MLPTEDLFVYAYVLVDDLITAGAIPIPPRPGPVPACSDAELLAITAGAPPAGPPQRGRLLGRSPPRLGHLFPRLPHQSQANRRIRWLWGAFEQFRPELAGWLPADDCQQVDTSALPVKHPSRGPRRRRLGRPGQRPGRPVRPRRRARRVVLRLPAGGQDRPRLPD